MTDHHDALAASEARCAALAAEVVALIAEQIIQNEGVRNIAGSGFEAAHMNLLGLAGKLGLSKEVGTALAIRALGGKEGE